MHLKPTHDFLADLGRDKGDRVVVGFAVETDDAEQNARRKLETKGLDLIVLNDLNVTGAGFGVDTNVVTLFDRDGNRTALDLMTKLAVSDHILDWVVDRWR